MKPNQCRACLREMRDLTDGQPPICSDCWQQMRPSERAYIVQQWEQNRSLAELTRELKNLVDEAKRYSDDEEGREPWRMPFGRN